MGLLIALFIQAVPGRWRKQYYHFHHIQVKYVLRDATIVQKKYTCTEERLIHMKDCEKKSVCHLTKII